MHEEGSLIQTWYGLGRNVFQDPRARTSRDYFSEKNMSLTLPCRQGKRMFYEEKWNELRHGSVKEDVKHWGSVDRTNG